MRSIDDKWGGTCLSCSYDSLRGLKDKDLHELTRIELLSKMIDKAGDAGFLGESWGHN